MLRRYRDKWYIVYPSWAKFSFAWEDLPSIFTDPLSSGYLDDAEDWILEGYPPEPGPFELVAGPCGGGIIAVPTSESRPWLPGVVLRREANIMAPSNMINLLPDGWAVQYLEPYSGWPAKRQRVYLCVIGVEHVESDRDSVYWLVGFDVSKHRSDIKGLRDLVDWAAHFGLSAEVCAELPGALCRETRFWVESAPECRFVWLKMRGGTDAAEWQFAVLTYCALQLASVAGRRLWHMHLVSSIEGRPSAYFRVYHRENTARMRGGSDQENPGTPPSIREDAQDVEDDDG